MLTRCVPSDVSGCHVQFELRYNEVDRARAVFERYVEVLPSVKAWVRYAKFELQHNDVARARSCYERAMEALGEDSHTVSDWTTAIVEVQVPHNAHTYILANNTA
jgi:hypothetical protein